MSAFCTDLNRKLAFAKEHEPELAAVRASKDFQLKLETKLRAPAAQDAAIASQPDNHRAFCEAKGCLYFIVNAVRALHASEPEAAAKYNLKVLYRSDEKRKADFVPPASAPAQAKERSEERSAAMRGWSPLAFPLSSTATRLATCRAENEMLTTGAPTWSGEAQNRLLQQSQMREASSVSPQPSCVRLSRSAKRWSIQA